MYQRDLVTGHVPVLGRPTCFAAEVPVDLVITESGLAGHETPPALLGVLAARQFCGDEANRWETVIESQSTTAVPSLYNPLEIKPR